MRCSTENKSVGWYYSQHRKLDFDPTYQREGGAWSLAKKQLFIDSLLNNFDIPKIYLHELDSSGPFDYAVIDGKQRITTLISFLQDEFPLSMDFIYEGDSLSRNDFPSPGAKFSEFSSSAQQILRDVQLASTIVRRSEQEEIEQLFSRLNDGEPLNNAETRNAFGGKITELIRDFAYREFFTDWLGYSNKRYAHRETACRLLFLEYNLGSSLPTPDLNKKALDNFVREKRGMSDADLKKLDKDTQVVISFMQKVFEKKSKELSKQSLPQVYYIWLRHIKKTYGHPDLMPRLKKFIEEFALRRIENNQIDDEQLRDPLISEFSYLSAQGTNTASSMNQRVEILTKFFLLEYPDTQKLDSNRNFSHDEKYVIWMRAGKKCQKCGRTLENFADFDADHIVRFSDGGATSMDNAQALCATCNRSKQ